MPLYKRSIGLTITNGRPAESSKRRFGFEYKQTVGYWELKTQHTSLAYSTILSDHGPRPRTILTTELINPLR
jgi:hypothetical protein